MVATVTQSGAALSTELYTAEEYSASAMCDSTELIEGRVFPLTPPNFEHGDIAAAIVSRLRPFVLQHGLGRAVVEGSFILRRDRDTVRAPDVAFLASSRLIPGERLNKYIEGAPTLAVEIISPTDAWSEVESKVHLYLASGTLVVWIVDPDSQTVTVRLADGTTSMYHESDTIPGGDILPGFQLPVRSIFE